MELDILHLDYLVECAAAGALQHDFVIQPQPEFIHCRQAARRLDRADDLETADVTIGVHL